MKTRIKLTNDFHQTQANVLVEPDKTGAAVLTKEQVKRVNRALCSAGCTCSGPTGTRGYQHDVESLEMCEDGRCNVVLRGWT